jgi:hypothetical protein
MSSLLYQEPGTPGAAGLLSVVTDSRFEPGPVQGVASAPDLPSNRENAV